MLSQGVTELRSDRFGQLQSCGVGEPQRCIHSLELQSCITTELLRIVNWEPGISGLGNRGVGWLGLGWGRVRDLGQACFAC